METTFVLWFLGPHVWGWGKILSRPGHVNNGLLWPLLSMAVNKNAQGRTEAHWVIKALGSQGGTELFFSAHLVPLGNAKINVLLSPDVISKLRF